MFYILYFIFFLYFTYLYFPNQGNLLSPPDQISVGLQTSHPPTAYIHHRQTTQDLSLLNLQNPTRVVLRNKQVLTQIGAQSQIC